MTLPDLPDVDPASNPLLPPGLQALGITKRFGSLTALDDVSLTVHPGSFHALLGGNGAGKSTLVKCIMGFYKPTSGEIIVGQRQQHIANPREAHALGIGMVYQHFTLVDNMTVAENLVLSRGDLPFRLDWGREMADLTSFMATMPFKVQLDQPVSALAAGEKQKLEILKQLYLQSKIIILDEPTSVLTAQEADDVLGMLKKMTKRRELSILIITHKFREVMAYADEVTILRLGQKVAGGPLSEFTPAQMAELMIGTQTTAAMADRATHDASKAHLTITHVSADDDAGVPALEDVNVNVARGETVAIVGVSGNGQSELVEVLAGQRRPTGGNIRLDGSPYHGRRREMRRHKLFCLPEEPLRNACVPNMPVGANMALRNFDQPPLRRLAWLVSGRALKKQAVDLINRYRVKTPSHATPIRNLSGGNVQRAVLARELAGDVSVLVAQNPCFGLDFAATAEIRSQIMAVRNKGAAVLLVTEDLDEAFSLADRIMVMFDGRIVYEAPIAEADLAVIGRHMAGHATEEVAHVLS